MHHSILIFSIYRYDNRPYIHIDITSLRRSLLKSLQSPNMAEDNSKKTVRWNDSPMVFDYTKRGGHSSANDSPILLDRSKAKAALNDSSIRFDRSKVKPTVPLINMYTPQKERVSPQIDGNNNTSQDNSPLANESVLNNNLNIESVLKDIGMQKYIEKFLLEEIDLFVFVHLLPQDLYELNIDEKDHETILQAIQVYAMWLFNIGFEFFEIENFVLSILKLIFIRLPMAPIYFIDCDYAKYF